MSMQKKEADRLRQLAGRMLQLVEVHLLAPDHPNTKEFEAFASLLADTLPEIRLTVTPTTDSVLPMITLGESWRFHCVPQGTELEPFLQILRSLGGTEPPVDDIQRKRVERIPWYKEVKLFVSTRCPHCPAVLRQLIPLAHFSRNCSITVIDCLLFPQWAAEEKIQAVPTLILAGQYRLTGLVRLHEILNLLEKTDSSLLSTEECRRMLKEGQAESLAQMMVQGGQVFPAFVPLVIDAEWSVRLGALVVMEELMEWDRDRVRAVMDELWEDFFTHDVTIQGDILHLVSALGDERWISRLKSLLEAQPREELRVVIQEVLEGLEKRGRR